MKILLKNPGNPYRNELGADRFFTKRMGYSDKAYLSSANLSQATNLSDQVRGR